MEELGVGDGVVGVIGLVEVVEVGLSVSVLVVYGGGKSGVVSSDFDVEESSSGVGQSACKIKKSMKRLDREKKGV